MPWAINTTLPPEAKEERRRYLRFYGLVSCFSSIAFFASACALRHAKWYNRSIARIEFKLGKFMLSRQPWFLWSMKCLDDIKWASVGSYDDIIEGEEEEPRRLMEVFVTGQHTELSGEIEMETSAADANREISLELARKGFEINLDAGRPKIRRVVQTAVAAALRGEGSVAILVCGPPGMGFDVKRVLDAEIDSSDETAPHIWFWNEEFGW